jgi:hypothetical protein
VIVLCLAVHTHIFFCVCHFNMAANSGNTRTDFTCILICNTVLGGGGMQWRSWLRHCVTSRKDTGWIPDGVIAIFH